MINPDVKPRPDLTKYTSLSDKFEAVIQFLSMDKVLCVIPNDEIAEFNGFPAPDQKFRVVDLNGPRTSYIKSLTNEWLRIFTDEAGKLLLSEINYNDITEQLISLKSQSLELHKKLNANYDLKFEETFRYYSRYKEHLYNIPLVHLHFDDVVYDELLRHFNLRSQFFWEMQEIMEENLKLHLTPRINNTRPYTWDSPHGELELSELLYTLLIVANRIKINDKEGGSFAKLKRELFGLFSLNEKDYNKKVAQIQSRKKDPPFIGQLSEQLNEHLVKSKKRRKKKSD